CRNMRSRQGRRIGRGPQRSRRPLSTRDAGDPQAARLGPTEDMTGEFRTHGVTPADLSVTRSTDGSHPQTGSSSTRLLDAFDEGLPADADFRPTFGAKCLVVLSPHRLDSRPAHADVLLRVRRHYPVLGAITSEAGVIV